MSAYGAIAAKSSSILETTIWPTKSHSESTSSYLTLHHLNYARASTFPGLIEAMHSAFAQIIDEGTTYPQETPQGEEYTRAAFDAYFFAGDVIIGVIGSDASIWSAAAETLVDDVSRVDLDIQKAGAGRSWEECVAGFYYVRDDPILMSEAHDECRSSPIILGDHLM